MLIKKSLEIHQIYLYGVVSKKNHLSSHGINVNLNNTYIRLISFFGGNKYKNTQDRLTIYNKGYTHPLNFPFTYSPINGYAMIEININFIGYIRMNTQTATNITFIISYLPLTFNTR